MDIPYIFLMYFIFVCGVVNSVSCLDFCVLTAQFRYRRTIPMVDSGRKSCAVDQCGRPYSETRLESNVFSVES